MSFNNIFFILNKPQLSENICACARAMKNFNFSNLVIINPKPSFPNDKIFATSVGAKEIIQKAKVYENFEDSLSKKDPELYKTIKDEFRNLKNISKNKEFKVPKKFTDFRELFNSDNFNKYNCIFLPFDAVIKALKL